MIIEELGLQEESASEIIGYLENKDLVMVLGRKDDYTLIHRPRNISFDLISITSKGVDEVEAALSGKKTPTEGIPTSITNFYVGGNISQSQISHNSPDSSQTYTIQQLNLDKVREIPDLLASI